VFWATSEGDGQVGTLRVRLYIGSGLVQRGGIAAGAGGRLEARAQSLKSSRRDDEA
jgi:hypothetical protein